MYTYTSKGYKFVEYEAPEPPRNSAYDRVMRGIARRAEDDATAYPSILKNPYKRKDFAEMWDVAYEYAYQRIHEAVTDIEARYDAGRAALDAGTGEGE